MPAATFGTGHLECLEHYINFSFNLLANSKNLRKSEHSTATVREGIFLSTLLSAALH